MLQTKAHPDRSVIAIAAVIMQISLGAVYGYSALTRPIMAVGGWSQTAVTAMFETAIFCLGITCLLGGIWQDRVGPRLVATTGGVLYGLGYILTAYGISGRSLPMIILGYGVVGGAGIGLAYITPVATLVKWFPDLRGVMTGLAVAGFGFGAIIMTQFVNWWMPHHGVASTLYAMGIGYGVIVIIAALTFADPPPGWRPAGWAPAAGSKNVTAASYTPAQALRTIAYWQLWLMLFLQVSGGIMIISTLTPMAVDRVGMTTAAAVALVGFMGLFNGGGRLFWAWVSDHIGRSRVFLLLFLLQAASFALLLVSHSVAMFAAVTAVIYLCYGGAFGTMPSFTADYFGSEYVGTIYGSILLAWGFGGVFSPFLISYLRETTGSYNPAIAMLAVVMLIGVILPLTVKPPSRARAGS